MTEPADPAASPGKVPTAAEELVVADALYLKAKSLRVKDPETAVRLFSEVLKTRVHLLGSKSAEAAESYLEYGIVLFNRAVDASDCCGEKALQAGAAPAAAAPPTTTAAPAAAAKSKPAKAAAAGAAAAAAKAAAAADAAESSEEEEEASESGSGADEDGNEEGVSEPGEAAGKPAGAATTATAAADGDASEEVDDGMSDSEDLNGYEVVDDMNLAFQNLELARLAYEQLGGAAKYPNQLADVHIFLGDIETELEHWDEALAEYQQCLDALLLLPVSDPRRVAEAHLKITLGLQWKDDLTAALVSCRASIDQILIARAAVDAKAEAAATAAGADTVAAAAAVATADSDAELLDAMLADLRDKEEELVTQKQDQLDMATMIRGVFSTSGAVVQDLGVAGRGRGRITLQPMPAAANPGAAAGGSSGGVAAGALAAAVQPAPLKRTLAQLMGGGPEGGATTVGFGSGVAAAAPAPVAMAAKRVRPVATGVPTASVAPASGAPL